jgi:hypothetical protein
MSTGNAPEEHAHANLIGDPEDLELLHPDVVKVWRIKHGIAAAVFVLAALVYDITNIFDQTRAIPLGLLSIGVLSAGVLWVVLVPRFHYRFWRYALRTDELYLRHGILNRVHTIVPLMRIQHLDVSQDIVEREYDLGKLIVHTAGTRSSTVIVPGLHLELAERLRDHMKAFIIDEAL